MNPAEATRDTPPTAAVDPLLLLIRAHRLTMWRKLKSLGQQSRLLSSVIALFISSYLVIAFWLFRYGLQFLDKFPPLGTLLTERLLYLLFFFLFVLLLLSNLVVSYSNLFRNRESAFLLSLPVSSQTIFRWKLIESAALASWAFVFLVAPLVAAFGTTRQVPWHFYPMTTAMVALFIVLPAVGGSFLAVQVARYLDRRMFQVLALGALLIFVAVAAFWLKPEPVPDDLADTRVMAVLDKMLVKTHFAQWLLWPSHWLSKGVLLWADGIWAGAMFFMLLLLSYVLLFGTLAFTGMGKLFYGASSAMQSRTSVFGRWTWFRRGEQRLKANRFKVGGLDRVVRVLVPLPPDTHALVVKDIRMFWRDTTQWAQSLVLFGLLGVYIFNLRHFTQQLSSPFWVHLVSFLNLGACSLNLATLTTRFVYPQFSLEGKRLWIIGMTPMGMRRVLVTKFWLAALTSEMVTLALITLSCHMLKMSWNQMLYFAGAVTIMTFTLTGLAVGLGALYPNFKEENPSKIVSGFGGTFCLVLSFLYILGAVVLLALASPWGGVQVLTPSRSALCLAGFTGLSFGLGWVPFHLGLRHLKSSEY